MQIKHLAAACAVALAAPAFALSAFDTPDLTVYLSGATAPDGFLESIATGMFTGSGVKNTDYFKYLDNVDQKQQRAFFGTMKSTVDIPAALQGKKVLFIKRSTGGSVWGVNPVGRNQGIATLKITSGGCTLTSGDYLCPVLGVDPGLGTQTGEERVPDFGVSDVSPALFKQPFNVEFGQTELTADEVANMTIKGVNVLSMGFAVTNVIPPAASFSRAVYGAMLSGNRTTWTGAGFTAPAVSNHVVVCRRVPGSGTQASYNWQFNNFPCTKQSVAGSGDTAPTRMEKSAGYNDADEDGVPDVGDGLTALTGYEINPATGYTVLENSTSGNVRDCLTKAANGGVHTFKDEQARWFKVDFGTGGYGAIGVLSTDSLSDVQSDGTAGTTSPAGTAGYSFRAVDGKGAMWDGTVGTGITVATTAAADTTGVLPTKANLIDGKYDFAVELTMQYNNSLDATKKAFAEFFIARAGAPANNTANQVAALPPTYSYPAANVARGTRFGNMCAPLQLQ